MHVEAAEAARKLRIRERTFRDWLMTFTDASEDDAAGSFHFFSNVPDDLRCFRDYFSNAFPNTVTLTTEGKTMIEGEVAPTLIAAWMADPQGFRKHG